MLRNVLAHHLSVLNTVLYNLELSMLRTAPTPARPCLDEGGRAPPVKPSPPFVLGGCCLRGSPELSVLSAGQNLSLLFHLLVLLTGFAGGEPVASRRTKAKFLPPLPPARPNPVKSWRPPNSPNKASHPRDPPPCSCIHSLPTLAFIGGLLCVRTDETSSWSSLCIWVSEGGQESISVGACSDCKTASCRNEKSVFLRIKPISEHGSVPGQADLGELCVTNGAVKPSHRGPVCYFNFSRLCRQSWVQILCGPR